MQPQSPGHPFLVYITPPLLVAALKITSTIHAERWTFNWTTILSFLLVCHLITLVWKYWWKAPSHVFIAAYPTPLGRWLTALRMTFDSETLLQRAYKKANGEPFAVPMTDRWIVFVSDQDQLRELEQQPEVVLSMEQALHELALTAPILGQFQVPPELKGPKSEAFRVMTGVLKNRLRSNIPNMSNSFKDRIKEAVEKETSAAPEETEGWSSIRLMPALLRIFTRVNLLIFLGEEEASSPETFDEVMQFLWTCALAFPILILTPVFLMPAVAPIAMGFGIARWKLYRRFLNITHEAMTSSESRNSPQHPSGYLAQWTAEMTKFRDVITIAKVTFGLFFASAFQVPMIAQFCLYRICKHPECIDTLLDEAIQNKDLVFGTKNEEIPYLDSFLKETARLSPGPIVSAPRTVMHPYTLPSGAHIPSGNWLAIPQLPFMSDESVWPDGAEFKGFRFVDKEAGVSETRFTHPSYSFPFWGSLKHACPARFYVSVVLKMVVSHFLINYELKLKDATVQPFWTFGKVRLPNPRMTLMVRERKQVSKGNRRERRDSMID